ncbi:SDR family NAD(P)-dependent oxidoreductase [Rhodosalinus sediminis]|jgi:NAD(P)-dependent dehydrogenase (short-subunit alcohol dehydrogenase family)|uniref:SDR family NAD(P)-dependent oxidoreductase n=1 Tax=Rhodosalinus sediminis TaxID=1940533 RepID=UPI0023532E7D|nr:SDR family NAD(P)-dependent oxidoreductase [Rhodosalinus sediminis]
MTDDRPLALVTGASRGLGAALAETLAATHHVLAVARTQGALEELDDRIRAAGGQATLAPMDLTQADAVAGLARGIFDRWGRLDLWAHTAIHAPPLSPAPSIDAKGFARALATNVTATQALIAALAPLLGTEGRALFFDDPQAGEAFFGGYGATKAAQAALARSWQAETVRTGPRVQVLTPAPMPTALRARFFPGEARDDLADRHAEARRLLAAAD